MNDGRIKLPDGTYVKIGDSRHGQLGDAACQKRKLLSGVILIQRSGAQLCQKCAREAGDKR